MLKMDFYFIDFDGKCTRLCRSWSCPLASSAFSGNSLVIKPYLKCSRAVLKIICRTITCFLTGYFCPCYPCTSGFLLCAWSVAGVAADAWQAAPRPRQTQLGRGHGRGAKGTGAGEFNMKPRMLPKVLAGAVPAGV